MWIKLEYPDVEPDFLNLAQATRAQFGSECVTLYLVGDDTFTTGKSEHVAQLRAAFEALATAEEAR